MEVYRIAAKEYADGLYASGVQNRWNVRDQWVIYCGSSRSLSTLELLVHRQHVSPQRNYKVMCIQLPNSKQSFEYIDPNTLPNNWRKLKGYTYCQSLGSQWYSEQRSLVLAVPSAVIPQEWNFVINTEHPDFNKVQLEELENYFWDSRLK
jgi:RES domain-containing protein